MIAREFAVLIGVTEGTVSRIASGDRRPSLDLMLKIKAELDWPLDEQGDQQQAGTYHIEFARRMVELGAA